MRKYWLPKECVQGDLAQFNGDTFHHIFDVCRQQVGSRFEILSGDNRASLVEVQSVGKKSATAKIISVREIPALPKPHIHLVLSIPRFPVMEAVVEKAVEMGVHTLHPVFSDFSFVRKAVMLPESKTERWQRIVVSATQQCGRGELMHLSETKDLQDLLKTFNQTKGQVGLFAYEGQATQTVRQYLRGRSEEQADEVWLFVGSEGGFSSEEVQSFQKAGLDSVSLGEQVLRVETACIALVAILKYEYS
jgi:16S rRNA (uracil1498-N3)-methyltransferase